MNACRTLALFAVIAALQGCATPVKEADAWPSSLPPRAYFQRVYAADKVNAGYQTEEQYLAWVRRYYEGSELFALGYLDLQAQVLDGREGAAARALGQKLEHVGMRIGGEWAKDRGVTRIRTRTLAAWGNALRSAVAAGDVVPVVDRIVADVDAILTGGLDASVVTAQRYVDPAGSARMDACDDPHAEFDERCLVAGQ